MTPDLSSQIEIWMRAAPGWHTAEELCRIFEVNERALRGVGDEPGLVTEFAISGNKGYRHIRHATDEEFDRCRLRLRGCGIGHLKHVKRLCAARTKELTGAPPVELHTGQTLLPIRT